MNALGGSGMLASLVIVAGSLSPLQVVYSIAGYDGEHMLFVVCHVYSTGTYSMYCTFFAAFELRVSSDVKRCLQNSPIRYLPSL
jgi:hypothetical protein